MNIYVCIHSGLCSGAQAAVESAYQNLNENLYMYGDVLHNPVVLSELRLKGAKTIHSINEIKYLENKNEITVLIRAHGVPKSVIDELDENNIKYLDKTCKEVKRIHEIVAEASQQGKQIIIIGNKDHPEIIGTIGWIKGDPIILANMEEVKCAIPKLTNPAISYSLVAQTTYNSKKYTEIIRYLKNHIVNLECHNTVCMDTENRQQELRKLSQMANTVIVIGGKNSSNSNKLYNIALSKCDNVQFIETYKELDFSNITVNDFIVIASGASTPDNSIQEVANCLHSYCRDMTSNLQ